MKSIATGLVVVASAAVAVFMFYSFHLVVEDKFDWNQPYALPVALGAIVAIVVIAWAAYGFKQSHPRQYGLQQIVIGCVVLMSQFGEPLSSGGFALRFLAAVFFLVQGIENFNRNTTGKMKA